ncbi:uncharacterized protein LOC105850054 isoform X1 [Hydra vulgaris]|uniref:uncharacterized protein LOC105850054 isoform X1 n=1 Tax=Hydra vulgaris TaxID=6087 RepID=UPI0001926800|nr:uncharacterized protein LOC105850054 [Hydra vulgaris]
MRGESPLDVLSRAASIVQNEEKAGNMRNQLKTGQLSKGIVFSDVMEVPTKEIYRKSQIISKSSQESKFMNSKLCELPVLTASYISKSQNINEHCKLPPPYYHLHKLYEPNNYTEHSKSKSLITSPRYLPYQHHISTKDFERPSVDDHFRKSLGDQYLTSKNSYVIENDKPCSVDEHFAKALGKKWKLENEKPI